MAFREVDGPGDHLGDRNKTEAERLITRILSHVWNLTKKKGMKEVALDGKRER